MVIRKCAIIVSFLCKMRHIEREHKGLYGPFHLICVHSVSFKCESLIIRYVVPISPAKNTDSSDLFPVSVPWICFLFFRCERRFLCFVVGNFHCHSWCNTCHDSVALKFPKDFFAPRFPLLPRHFYSLLQSGKRCEAEFSTPTKTAAPVVFINHSER